MESDKKLRYSLLVVLFFCLAGLGLAFYFTPAIQKNRTTLKDVSSLPTISGNLFEGGEVAKFKSRAEVEKYLQKVDSFKMGGGAGRVTLSAEQMPTVAADSSNGGLSKNIESSGAQRYSQTNVRTSGVDEPDIVKTDGKEIYYSQKSDIIFYDAMIKRACLPGQDCTMPAPVSQNNKTNLIAAFPPDQMKKDSKIDVGGEMLVFGQTLVIFGDKTITAFDVSDKTNPKELWKNEIAQGSSLSQVRKIGESILLVENSNLTRGNPCPIAPLSVGGGQFNVRCEDIFYPKNSNTSDGLVTVLEINSKSGAVEKSASFLAGVSYGNDVVYVSNDNIFITYTTERDLFGFLLEFLQKNKDLVLGEDLARLEKIAGYDISQEAKMVEIYKVLNFWDFAGSDESLKKRTEMENRMRDFYSERKRNLESTGIIKVSLGGLNLEATGKVPGSLLNDFSLDEFNGNLRLATTVGQNGVLGFGGLQESSVSDLYVLDSKLEKVGELLDLGKGERIYAARFVGKDGFLVTFKQIDPFFVLDLSNPKNPQKSGELKIPGYSSYLHPLGEDLILGIGKEDQKVKLSLFDVKNSTSPQEIAKYTLDEYWSEALDNRRAFLIDPERKVFFLPGSQGGYVFSYQDGKLELKLASSGEQVERALYLDGFLYVISKNKIMVYAEENWSKVKELIL